MVPQHSVSLCCSVQADEHERERLMRRGVCVLPQGALLSRGMVGGMIYRCYKAHEEATVTIDEPVQLHDRATRGEVLSNEEQRRLEQWYAEQDRVEQALLDASDRTTHPTLQQQIDVALAQLQNVVLHIEDLSHQNDALRRNIADAQRQLAQRQPSRAA